jgi:hypothetical protein
MKRKLICLLLCAILALGGTAAFAHGAELGAGADYIRPLGDASFPTPPPPPVSIM